MYFLYFLLIFDTGIFQRILGLKISDIIIGDVFEVINKGHIAELYVGLELLKVENCFQKTELYYWQRDAKNSQAEVDYVCQFNENIVPLEVKSGTKGSMQSLYLFLKEKNSASGIRLSLENFSSLDQVDIFPIYSIQNMKDKLNRQL